MKPGGSALHFLERPIQLDLHPAEVLVYVSFANGHFDAELSPKSPYPGFADLFFAGCDVEGDLIHGRKILPIGMKKPALPLARRANLS